MSASLLLNGSDAQPDHVLVDGSRPFTGEVAGVDPTSGTALATAEFVAAAVVAGVVYKDPVRFVIEDDAPLPAYTYANGALGVGATITADANGTIPDQDGVTPAPGDRCLHEHAADLSHGGIYVVTSVGSGGSKFVLTRATDCDESADFVAGIRTLITEGSHAGVVEVMNPLPGFVVGTSPALFLDVGLPASDAAHGHRGGANLHSEATGASAGFMSAAAVTKLAGIETGADVTDEANVLTALATGPTAKALGGGSITNVNLVDGRDVSVDGAKLDGIEAGANVTTTARVLAGLSASAAAKDVGGGSITNVNLVDGRDVSADGSVLDALAARVFGLNFQTASSEANATNATNVYSTKLTLTTPALTGTYRVGAYLGIATGANNKRAQARLYNSTDAAELASYEETHQQSGVFHSFSPFCHVTFAGAAKTFVLQIASPDNSTTITGRRFRLEFWGVS